MTVRPTDLLNRLTEADPVDERRPETADERREADALLARLLITPVEEPPRRLRSRRHGLANRRSPRLAFAAVAAVVLAAIALVARDVLDTSTERDAIAARAYATLTDQNAIFHSVYVITLRTQGLSPEEGSQDLVETWRSGRGDSGRTISYAYRGGRRGEKEVERGFDRRGGFIVFGDGQVERSVVTLGEGPPKAAPLPGGDGRPFDPTADFKAAYKTGRVRFEGERVLRGRPVYVLVVELPRKELGPGTARISERDTYIVDRRSYLPVEVRSSGESTQDGQRFRTSFVQRFLTYEKLPRTPENLAALRPSKGR